MDSLGSSSVTAGSLNLLTIIVPAIVAALVALATNWLTTKWRAKHEYLAHAQKIFFERKITVYIDLSDKLKLLDQSYRWIWQDLKKGDQDGNNLIGRLRDRTEKFKNTLTIGEFFLSDRLHFICVDLTSYAEGLIKASEDIVKSNINLGPTDCADKMAEIEGFANKYSEFHEAIKLEMKELGITYSPRKVKWIWRG